MKTTPDLTLRNACTKNAKLDNYSRTFRTYRDDFRHSDGRFDFHSPFHQNIPHPFHLSGKLEFSRLLDSISQKETSHTDGKPIRKRNFSVKSAQHLFGLRSSALVGTFFNELSISSSSGMSIP